MDGIRFCLIFAAFSFRYDVDTTFSHLQLSTMKSSTKCLCFPLVCLFSLIFASVVSVVVVVVFFGSVTSLKRIFCIDRIKSHNKTLQRLYKQRFRMLSKTESKKKTKNTPEHLIKLLPHKLLHANCI